MKTELSMAGRAMVSLLALSASVACSGDGGGEGSSVNPVSPPPSDGTTDPPGSGGSSSVGKPPSDAPGAGGETDQGGEGGAAPVPLDGPAAGAGGSAMGSDVPAPACARDVTEANKATVVRAIDELFVQGDITAVDRYWGEPYLQHNPIAASGVVAFRNLFSGLINPGSSIYDLSRVVGECELVLIHGDYTSFGGPTFDLFRVEGGRLVEHWDSAATGAGPNASGHTALDGESVVADVELSGQNEALVLAFVDRVLIDAGHDAIGEYMSPALIEHAPDGSDGSDAYVQSLQSRGVAYRRVHRSIGDGNFVFVLSEGDIGATAVAHYDLFRIDAGLIVEHWDARRDVPASTASGLGIF
jgi:predicted SnoaL-like aldol condensation-catalyzing enzyme